MRVQYENILPTAPTISVSSNEIATPKTFLYDQYLSNFLLFTGNTAESVTVDADSGNTFSVSSIGIAGHNFTSSATITLEGNSTNVWTAPAFSATITYKADTITQFLSSTQVYRYFRLTIADSTNTDALEIGYLYLGGYVDFPGFRPNVNISNVFNDVQTITRGGQISGSKEYEYRTVSVNFPAVTNTERLEILEVAREMNTHKTLFISVWQEDFDTESAIYGVFNNKTVDQTKEPNNGVLWNIGLTFREAK